MCRRAKAKQPYAIARLDTRNAQAAKANDAGTQEGRGMKVIQRLGKWENKVAARKRIFSVATRHGVAGKCRRVAKILKASLAIAARAVRASNPRHAYARAQRNVWGSSVDDLA